MAIGGDVYHQSDQPPDSKWRRFWRFVFEHQLPAVELASRDPAWTAERHVVRIVAGHMIRHGFGDELVDWISRTVDRRPGVGAVATASTGLDGARPAAAQIILVPQYAGATLTAALDAGEVGTEQGFGIPTVLIGYGAPTSARAAVLRVAADLSRRGAELVDTSLVVDTAGLRSRGRVEPFDEIALDLLLDGLLDGILPETDTELPDFRPYPDRHR